MLFFHYGKRGAQNYSFRNARHGVLVADAEEQRGRLYLLSLNCRGNSKPNRTMGLYCHDSRSFFRIRIRFGKRSEETLDLQRFPHGVLFRGKHIELGGFSFLGNTAYRHPHSRLHCPCMRLCGVAFCVGLDLDSRNGGIAQALAACSCRLVHRQLPHRISLIPSFALRPHQTNRSSSTFSSCMVRVLTASFCQNSKP